MGKTLPAGTPLRVIVTPPQLSFAVAVPNVVSLTTAPQVVALAPVMTLTGAGAVIVGGGLDAVAVTIAELLLVSESGVAELTVAVLLSAVPLLNEQLT